MPFISLSTEAACSFSHTSLFELFEKAKKIRLTFDVDKTTLVEEFNGIALLRVAVSFVFLFLPIISAISYTSINKTSKNDEAIAPALSEVPRISISVFSPKLTPFNMNEGELW